MVVNLQQIRNGVTRYVEAEIGQKATGLTKFMVYFILPKLSKQLENLVLTAKDNPITKDLFDENGNVNLDEVYNTAKEAIKKSGQIEMYGIIFNETDIDKLYTYIKNPQQ